MLIRIKKGSYLKKRQKKTIILFLAPIFIFAVLFSYYPFARIIINSFSKVNATGFITGFDGLSNYTYVFSRSDFGRAVSNTLLLTLLNVPVTMILALLFALLTEKKSTLGSISEFLFTLPMAISMSAAALIFKSMFSPDLGIINKVFGINTRWFQDPKTSLITVVFLTVWMGIGFNYLLFLYSLRNIPKGVVEAARLDGSRGLGLIMKIKIPLISQTILYTVITNLILAMTCSAPMIIITQGGPSRSTTTLLYMMYSSGLGSSDYGLAAVVSIVCFVLTMLLTVIIFFATRKKVFYR